MILVPTQSDQNQLFKNLKPWFLRSALEPVRTGQQ